MVNDQDQGQDGPQDVNNAPDDVQEAVEDTQLEPVPSSEQKPTEGVADEEQEALSGSKNPERTKAYIEKLKSDLAAEKAKNTKTPEDYGNSVFDSFRPQVATPAIPVMPDIPDAGRFNNLNQNQVNNIANQFVAPDGTVDIDGLNNALNLANRRAMEAERRAKLTEDKVTRFEETQQVRDAHGKFPQLDPKSPDFDPKFYDLTRDRLLRNMYEGREQSLLEAAESIADTYQRKDKVNVAEVEAKAVEKYKQSQTNRNQGPIESGRGEPREQSQGDLAELRKRTRQGDPNAISKRLKDIGL